MVVSHQNLTLYIEIIRAYQTRKAQEQWGMTPLPIVKNDMQSFENQVFCSKSVYEESTLILFIHDAPDVVLSENAMLSNKMDLSEAFLVFFSSVALISSWMHQINIINGRMTWVLD